MSAPTVAQDAALVALEEGEPDVERMRAEYDRRRRLVVDGFHAIGLETFEPRGAFYAFPRITSTGLDSETFAERLLEEEHVAVVPGGAFGASGDGTLRAGLLGSPGLPPGHQPPGRGACPRDGRGDRRADAGAHPLGPQELLLPGPAEGLPDQPVRPAARRRRRADDR